MPITDADRFQFLAYAYQHPELWEELWGANSWQSLVAAIDVAIGAMREYENEQKPAR